MRGTVVAGAALGIVIAAAAPALASPPEIQQKSCEANGGTFDRDHGVKSCTTTIQSTWSTGPVTNVVGFSGGMLTGVSSRTDVISVSTTQTQKGNGDVSTSQTETVLSSTVTGISCTQQIAFFTFTVDNGVCVQNGAFLSPSPLGPVA